MALDWNKEISFTGLKKGNKGEKAEKPPKTQKSSRGFGSRGSKENKAENVPTAHKVPRTTASPQQAPQAVNNAGAPKGPGDDKASKPEKGKGLSREISFSRGGKGASKSSFPTKTYINLAPQTSGSFNARKTIPMIVVAAIVAVLVIKFGVLDMFGQVNARQAALEAAEATRTQIIEQLVDYNDVLVEYQSYEASSLSIDPSTVSALDALDLVDRVVAPAASVKSLSLDSNVMSLNLTNISLDGLGTLQNRLLDEDMVVNVSVSTAATESTAPGDVSAAMIVTLQRVIEE